MMEIMNVWRLGLYRRPTQTGSFAGGCAPDSALYKFLSMFSAYWVNSHAPRVVPSVTPRPLDSASAPPQYGYLLTFLISAVHRKAFIDE